MQIILKQADSCREQLFFRNYKVKNQLPVYIFLKGPKILNVHPSPSLTLCSCFLSSLLSSSKFYTSHSYPSFLEKKYRFNRMNNIKWNCWMWQSWNVIIGDKWVPSDRMFFLLRAEKQNSCLPTTQWSELLSPNNVVFLMREKCGKKNVQLMICAT